MYGRTLGTLTLTAGALLLSAATNAAIVQVVITGGAHTLAQVGGSNNVPPGSLAPLTVYETGTRPTNTCTSGTSTCPTTYSVATNAGGLPQISYTVGSLYGSAATTPATYSGTIIYDNVTNQVLDGILNYSGTYGEEFVVNSTSAIGSFFYVQFGNGSVTLGQTPTVSGGVRAGTFTCDVGGAGYAIVGTLIAGNNVSRPYSPLCAFQNQASYAYGGFVSGTPVRNFTFVPTGPNAGTLTLNGNRFTLSGSGNNLQEVFSVTTALVPVPAAAWLFGSALGLMGLTRRNLARRKIGAA